ncbi:hypothetical protein CJ030_MR1G028608 [Morella rubra]|uniref:Uncharacterized protein n=1 Tax=Morella rubra TaxID=262757 RepID=A0A6A1WM00_9ROSI|nr:hypothetical protein CJ030_MR1G028608 [Morella rubra]
MELQVSNQTNNMSNGQPSNPELNPEPPNYGETRNTYESQLFFEDIDSSCSTPYVSAPSSPGRGPVSGFFYSAPASPMHFALSLAMTSTATAHTSSTSTMDDFEFSARFGSSGLGGTGSMSSADELFLNGKIRPMKLSTHLEQPQVLGPLLDLEAEEDDFDTDQLGGRGRDLRLRNKSLRRRTRSMSPMRNTVFEWAEDEERDKNTSSANQTTCLEVVESETEREKIEELCSETTTPSVSASSSRSSSAGRSSKRWVFLKDFLRSKSEGRSNNKFWSTISFTPTKEKKPGNQTAVLNLVGKDKDKDKKSTNSLNVASEAAKSKGNARTSAKKAAGRKPANGIGKRRVPPSPHELHYTANRAQAEEMRTSKTFLFLT